jgi:hypothetical protein
LALSGGWQRWRDRIRIAKDPSFENFRTLDDAFGFGFGFGFVFVFSPFKQPSQN